MNDVRSMTKLKSMIVTRLEEVAKAKIKGYVSLSLNDQWDRINVLTDTTSYVMHIDAEAKIGKLDPKVEMSDIINDGFFDFTKSKMCNTLHSIIHLNSNDNIYNMNMESLELNDETMGCLDIDFLCSLHSHVNENESGHVINYLYLLASKRKYSMLITKSLEILHRRTNFTMLMDRVDGFLRKELLLGTHEPEIILSKTHLVRTESCLIFNEDKNGDGSFTLKGSLESNGLIKEVNRSGEFNTIDTKILYDIITTIRYSKYMQFNHDDIILRIDELSKDLVKKY